MIRCIIKDTELLQQKSRKAIKGDEQIVRDLLDTAESVKDNCLGLAAIQIGEAVNIIVVRDGSEGNFKVMINPVIYKASSRRAQTEEGCLSLEGTRTATRHTDITVMYQPALNRKYIATKLYGLKAYVVQHEIDHLHGILI